MKNIWARTWCLPNWTVCSILDLPMQICAQCHDQMIHIEVWRSCWNLYRKYWPASIFNTNNLFCFHYGCIHTWLAPLRSSCIFSPVPVSKTLINVPFSLAVANLVPCKFSAIQFIWASWAGISRGDFSVFARSISYKLYYPILSWIYYISYAIRLSWALNNSYLLEHSQFYDQEKPVLSCCC